MSLQLSDLNQIFAVRDVTRIASRFTAQASCVNPKLTNGTARPVNPTQGATTVHSLCTQCARPVQPDFP